MSSFADLTRRLDAQQNQPVDLAKIAEWASIKAEERLMQKQAMVNYEVNRRHDAMSKIATVMDISATARLLTKMAENGQLSEAELAQLPALLEEANLNESALADLLVEGEDMADVQADAILEAALEDPEAAAELIASIDGIDVGGGDIDDATDVIAESILNDPSSSEKAASMNKYASALLDRVQGSPATSYVLQKIAMRKAYAYLANERQAQGHR